MSKLQIILHCLPREIDEVERICNHLQRSSHLLGDKIQLIPSKYEDDINSIVDLKPMWPTSGLVAIQFLLENYKNVYTYGFDGKSKKYEYIHYYDQGDETRLTERWHRPRVDHNIELEKKYLGMLRKDGKVIDIV